MLFAVVLVVSVALPNHGLAQGEGQVFSGTSPPIINSTATLTFQADLTTQKVFSWESSDPVLGDINTGDIPAATWNLSGSNPTRLVFTGSGGGATFYGNVLFEPYNRAVVDVVKGGKRLRYLLTKVVPKMAWANEKFEEPDFVPIPSEEVNAPFAHNPGEPGGQGGFGGPPAGSGFGALSDPFRIENLQVNDQGNILAGTMTLTLASNVSPWSKDYTLTETSADSNVYVDSEDSLAVQVIKPSADLAGNVDQIELFVTSMAFGSRRTMVVFETGPDTKVYASEHLQLVVTMTDLPDPGTVESINATLTSNLKTDTSSGVLTETSADSLVFENPDKSFSITFIRITSVGPSAKDDFTALVTSQTLQVSEAEVDAIETGVATLEFRTDALQNQGEPGKGPGAVRGLAIGQQWEPALKVEKGKPWPFGALVAVRALVQGKRGDNASLAPDKPTLTWRKTEKVTKGDFDYYPLLRGGKRVVFLLEEEKGTATAPVFVEDGANIRIRVKAGDVLIATPKEQDSPRDEITVFKIDLAAMKVNHNAANGELSEDQETNPGAFVPINNDDDDYDATNTADKDQTGPIVGESDLLPIILHKVNPAISGSKYTLVIPGQVRIWQKSDRSGAVSETTEFDANADTTLFVEGVTVGSGSVKINWKSGTTTLNGSDEVKVTVFNWLGPLNVPGYAIYRYTASGALGTSKWITPGSGTIKTAADTSDVTILWAEGPVVGKAVYQVNGDYVWDLEVNVVQVKMKQTGNSAAYDSSPFQVGGAGSALIKASSKVNCMTANLVIEKVEGPTVRGAQRGKKFIELGLVHQAGFDAKHGLYNNSSPRRRIRSSLQDGQTHWDARTATTIPWVFNDSDHYLDITSDTTVISNVTLKTFDNPALICTNQVTLAGDQVDVLALNMFHILYLSVRTKQNINTSHDVLTQRGRLNWRFDGTGNVDATGTWSLTGTGVTGDASFSEMTDGNSVPTAAANLNEELNTNERWITDNQ
ncbi:MAG TPA: hypothetical protein VJ508_13930 [Saprospiraceae bacterium]|nr:hypothetical protein [Saprospiraceae bacterium]